MKKISILLAFWLLACGQSEVRKAYYENGKLKSESSYIDGKINGFFKYYDENGNLVPVK